MSVKIQHPDGTFASTAWQWKVKYDPIGGLGYNFSSTIETCHELLVDQRWIGTYPRLVHTVEDALVGEWERASLPEKESLLSSNASPQPVTEEAEQECSQPGGVFEWLSDTQCTYGYLAFKNDTEGVEFGVFKYTTFMLGYNIAGCSRQPTWGDSEDGQEKKSRYVLGMMREKWVSFTKEAEARGITRLLVDMVGNGGGLTDAAFDFVRWMLPEVNYKEACGHVKRPVPFIADAWSRIDTLKLLQFQTIDGLRQTRIKELIDNSTAAGLVTKRFQAITHGLAQLRTMGDKGASDSALQEVWGMFSNASASADKFEIAMNVTVAQYADLGCSSPFTAGEDAEQWELAYKYSRNEVRGTRSRHMSATVLDCPDYESENLTNPFDDMIFVSDGTCGSSCYLASGQTWAVSKAYSNRSVRMATYGGVGGSSHEAKRSLSATSFPGGNVYSEGAAMLNTAMTCVFVNMNIANLMGDDDLLSQFAGVFDQVAATIPPYSNGSPRFSQSEVYQRAFGPNSPPAEYVFVPTDLYIPAWFHDMGGADSCKWNNTNLDVLYQVAAQGFGKQN